MGSKEEAAEARQRASRVEAAVKTLDQRKAAMLNAIRPLEPEIPEIVEQGPLSEREQIIEDFHNDLHATGQRQYVRKGQLPTAIPYIQAAYVRKQKP